MHQQQHKQSSSAHHSFFASDLHPPTVSNWYGVEIESGDRDHAPIIPDYRTLNNSLALRTHRQTTSRTSSRHGDIGGYR